MKPIFTKIRQAQTLSAKIAALETGGILKQGSNYYELTPGYELQVANDPTAALVVHPTLNFIASMDDDVYERRKPYWYEAIPSQGVLCWWTPAKQSVVIASKWDKQTGIIYDLSGRELSMGLTPLTQEELELFLAAIPLF
jgi:hypothetical protein